jgi:DNA-binding CsgD family transcriptional regulator
MLINAFLIALASSLAVGLSMQLGPSMVKSLRRKVRRLLDSTHRPNAWDNYYQN